VDNLEHFISADDLEEGDIHEETIIKVEDIVVENKAAMGSRSATRFSACEDCLIKYPIVLNRSLVLQNRNLVCCF